MLYEKNNKDSVFYAPIIFSLQSFFFGVYALILGWIGSGIYEGFDNLLKGNSNEWFYAFWVCIVILFTAIPFAYMGKVTKNIFMTFSWKK